MLRKTYPFIIILSALCGLFGLAEAHAHVYPDNPPQTRYLSILDSQLANLPGVMTYGFVVGTESVTPVSVPVLHRDFRFYEVSVVEGRGSWWVATTTAMQAPHYWYSVAVGGVADLRAEGPGIPTHIGRDLIVRPRALIWWVPTGALNFSPVQPGYAAGHVEGAFPEMGPGLL